MIPDFHWLSKLEAPGDDPNFYGEHMSPHSSVEGCARAVFHKLWRGIPT